MKPAIAIPATCALVYRAWSKKSLTPAGIAVAAATAVAHAYHPWNLPFALLCVFFLAGTRATHVKEDVKARLTMSSGGVAGGEGPRTHVQVLANSLVASVLSILHARQLHARAAALSDPTAQNPDGSICYSWKGDVLVMGIIANYAAVAADTFSSELGILATTMPRLITSPTLRKVPRGTNGGVTLEGLAAGAFGSLIITTASMVFLPLCTPSQAGSPGSGMPWTVEDRRIFMGFMILWGTLGSLLDSFLGGIFQQSVRDSRTGKIVEGDGGVRVLLSGNVDASQDAKAALAKDKTKEGDEAAVDDEDEDAQKYDPKNKHRKPSFGDKRPTRVVESGLNMLDNNDVNFIMAVTMSVGAMAVTSWYWEIPVHAILRP